jgi:hypothetical protein
MKISFKYLITALAVLFFINLRTAGQYRDNATLSRDLNTIAKANPSLCEIKSLAKTEGGKEILVLIIGTGEKHNKPGIAVLGGIEGNNILGREIAAGFAENLLKEASAQEVKDLLSKVTFYVFPDVSPDASEQFFAKIKYERNWNAKSVDNDRDFKLNEDPAEDLNNDGFITMMRVLDPNGTLIESSDDARLLVPADFTKGQVGKYILYQEGIDNDKDGRYNEDGEGGVNFNNNWTYNYEEFGVYAGVHPVSEPEVRAVADFLFGQWNIFATIAFGPQDNLGQVARSTGGQAAASGPAPSIQLSSAAGRALTAGTTTTAAAPTAASRGLQTIARADETVNRIVSEKYIETTGVKGTPASFSARGNFMEWAYFHYGRFSYSTPAWWPNVERGRSGDAAFLKYAEDNKLGDVFVPWTEVKHPAFPGKKVEVGGVKPFAMTTPPADKVSEIVASNYKFIKVVAAMHPEIEIKDLLIENTGGDIFRVTLKVHNKGHFATMAEIGTPNRFVRQPRVALTLESKQTVITGTKVQTMRRLDGNGSAEYSWLIRGKGTISVKAGDINCGIATIKADLK